MFLGEIEGIFHKGLFHEWVNNSRKLGIIKVHKERSLIYWGSFGFDCMVVGSNYHLVRTNSDHEDVMSSEKRFETINAKNTFARMANKVRAFANAVAEVFTPRQEFAYSFAA